MAYSGIKKDSDGNCTIEWATNIYSSRKRDVSCPAGYKVYHDGTGGGICYKTLDDTCPLGNPTSPASGAKRLTAVDFRAGSRNGLHFTRHYNSQGFYRVAWGEDEPRPEYRDYWRHYYGQRLVFHPEPGGLLAVAIRADGQPRFFHQEGLESQITRDYGYRLTSVVAGGPTAWRLTTPDEVIEEYDDAGRLLKVKFRDGRWRQLAYQDGRLASVGDQAGRALAFDYDAAGRLITLTDPDGGIIQYAYDALDRLTTVTYQDGAERQYLYSGSSHLVTGILDEDGERFATYNYNGGRVTLSEHAGGAQRHTFGYDSSGVRTYVTDPLGQQRTVRHATIASVRRQTALSHDCQQCGTEASNITYTADGLVQSRQDFNGNTTSYAYNGRGLEISRTEALGTPQERITSTLWHPTFRLPVEISEPDRRITYTYNADGQQQTKTVTDPATAESRTWTYAYCTELDAANPLANCPIVGRLKSVDGPRTEVADVTSYRYYTDAAADGSHRVGDLWQMINAAGHVTEYLRYDGVGRVLELKAPNGIRSSFTYDARGRITSRTLQHPTTGSNAITSFTYDAVGNLVKVTQPDGVTLHYEYDAAHRLVAIEDALGNRIEYTLDAAGNRIQERVLGSGGSVFQERSREYNKLNRLVQEINGVGDAAVHAYDAEGNRTATTDPEGNTTSYQYDALNRLAGSIDALNGATDYTYDDQDRLVVVTDPRGIATQYEYNGFGDLLSEQSPDAGTTTYTYDAAGNRISRMNARGQATTYEYDALNRLIRIEQPFFRSTDFIYDEGSNGIGRLTTLQQLTNSIQYSYNVRGHIVQDTRTINADALTFTTQYRYSLAGRVTGVTYPSGNEVRWWRDAAGEVYRITATLTDGVNAALAENVTHIPFGPVNGFSYGNGTNHTRSFDLAGRRISQQTGTGDPHQWTYDAAGNVFTWQIGAGSDYDQSFEYDALHRLIRAEGGYGLLEYTYDAVGNRTARTEAWPNGETFNSSYAYAPDSNRLLQAGDTDYNYDAAGNPVQIGDRVLTYNSENRLVTVEAGGAAVASYDYNALGQRYVKRTPNGDIYFVYDLEGRLIGEYDAQGAAVREYVYLDGEPLAMLRPDGDEVDVFYFHNDHRGAPQSLFAHEGDEGSGGHYKPFGERYDNWMSFDQPIWESRPPDLRLRYPGQYGDNETGFYYNYFRDYEPQTGRYVESDPIGLAGGLNTYAYALANPLVLFDPDGLRAWYCRRPLGGAPGGDVTPVLNHQYLCATQPNGQIQCGGQTSDNPLLPISPGRPTRPDEDYYDPDACELMDDDTDQCFEECLLSYFDGPRPPYGVGPQGVDCQEWAGRGDLQCSIKCLFQ